MPIFSNGNAHTEFSPKVSTAAQVKISINTTATKFFHKKKSWCSDSSNILHSRHRMCSLLSKERRSRQVNSSGLIQFSYIYIFRVVEQLINIDSLAHHTVCYVMARPCAHAASKQELTMQVNTIYELKLYFSIIFSILILHGFALTAQEALDNLFGNT